MRMFATPLIPTPPLYIHSSQESPLEFPSDRPEEDLQLPILRSSHLETPTPLSFHQIPLYKALNTARVVSQAGHADADGFTATAMAHHELERRGLPRKSIRSFFTNETHRFLEEDDLEKALEHEPDVMLYIDLSHSHPSQLQVISAKSPKTRIITIDHHRIVGGHDWHDAHHLLANTTRLYQGLGGWQHHSRIARDYMELLFPELRSTEEGQNLLRKTRKVLAQEPLPEEIDKDVAEFIVQCRQKWTKSTSGYMNLLFPNSEDWLARVGLIGDKVINADIADPHEAKLAKLLNRLGQAKIIGEETQFTKERQQLLFELLLRSPSAEAFLTVFYRHERLEALRDLLTTIERDVEANVQAILQAVPDQGGTVIVHTIQAESQAHLFESVLKQTLKLLPPNTSVVLKQPGFKNIYLFSSVPFSGSERAHEFHCGKIITAIALPDHAGGHPERGGGYFPESHMDHGEAVALVKQKAEDKMRRIGVLR